MLARLESANTGKPLTVSRDDVDGTIDTFRFMAGAPRATTSLAAANYAEDHLSVILREPLGVVGVITPWNYPLLMAAWKIAPILAAGNTMVIKPSEQTPLTTLKLAELVADLLPAGVLNVVTGTGPEVGARLAEHPDVDMIALTGSVNSGRAVARAAAESLKRVHLELGGKAPVVIFGDAELGAAAEALRAAGYWNSGQECGAGCRMLVEESVAEEFVELLVRAGPRPRRRRARRRRRRRDRPGRVQGTLRSGAGLPEPRSRTSVRVVPSARPCPAPATSWRRPCSSTSPTAPSAPGRRSSGPSSPWRHSPTKTMRSTAPTMFR